MPHLRTPVTILENPNYKAKVERAMILRVEAFDWNSPQHITTRCTIEEIKQINQPLYEHIDKLEVICKFGTTAKELCQI